MTRGHEGNAATEIVKYFFQLHYGIKKDYRLSGTPRARQLLPERLMGVIRAEPARVTDWAAKSVGAAWRAFDLQLTTYAACWPRSGSSWPTRTASRAASTPLEAGNDLHARPDVGRHRRRRLHRRDAFDYRWLKTLAWPVYGAPARPARADAAIGDGVGGSARWITFGPFTFQFSELAKILMIIVLANYLASRQGKLDSLRTILGACVLVGPPWLLVMLQPDLGTSLVFAAILAGMLWMSGASMKWLGALAAAVVAMVPIAWTYILRDYQKERLTSFLNPNPDITGSGYQLYQSQIAVGSGGLFGQGPDQRHADPGRLPAGPDHRLRVLRPCRGARLHRRPGDVRALFVLLLWRVLVAGWRSRDPFGTLFAAGLASMILFQLVVNVGMVMGIMPITGIPLPFVTHGGASLVSLAIGLGILQSINIRQTRAEW